MHSSSRGAARVAVALSAGLALALAPTLASADVNPLTVERAADPGTSFQVTKTVTTPLIPPKPDIVFVVDETGSMGGAIANVRTELGSIMTAVKAAQPDSQFAVTSYRDVGEARTFVVGTDLSADAPTVQTAINSLTALGGGDEPEAQLNALWQVGDGGDAIAFRADSSRIVVWFGDAPGHDPSNGHTEADAIASLQVVDAQVLAIGVSTVSSGLNSTGQAQRIADATGGTFYNGVAPGQVATKILDGLHNLPATVTASTTCSAGLSVSFDPALPQTVASGSTLTLTETLTVAADAPQGSTLTCTTAFLINGVDAGDGFTQTVSIPVNDVTPPTVSCGPGVNPAGVTPGGWQKAGFYELVAADNQPGVTVTITDTVTRSTFGPYAPGTHIKLTQAVGASTSTVNEFPGTVDWQFRFAGDALVTATDAAGNTATATCAVPPAAK